MVAPSATRVPEHTDRQVNEHIRREAEARIEYFCSHPDQIDQRLRELDEEWDVERMLATGSSCLSLLGLALTLTRGRKWVVLPLAVQSFYLQHTLQGWCPPLPVLRRLGFRTPDEINEERYALKAIRGGSRAEGAADYERGQDARLAQSSGG